MKSIAQMFQKTKSVIWGNKYKTNSHSWQSLMLEERVRRLNR